MITSLRIRVVVFLLLPCPVIKPCTDNGLPVADGSALFIERTVPKNGPPRSGLTWKIKLDSGGQTSVTTCYRSQKNPCSISVLPDNYISTLKDVKGARAGKDLAFSIRINELNRIRDQTRWSWNDGTKKIGECDLDIYSFQTEPTCNGIRVNEDGKTISWSCDVYNIYPNVTCMFAFALKQDEESPEYQRISPIIVATRNGKRPPRTTYHDFKCQLAVPMNSFETSGAYLFRFKAVMFGTVARSVKPAELFLGTLGFPPDYEVVIQHHTTYPGKDVSIEFPITGFPSPQSFNLSRIRTSKMETNETGEVEVEVREPVDVDRYNVTYTPGNFTGGDVSLTMFNMADDESDYYVLSVDNGIGGVLDFKYYAFVRPVVVPDEPWLSFLWFALDAAQLGLGIGIIMAVFCFIAGMKVQKRRLSRKKTKKDETPRREEETEEEGEEETVMYEEDEGERGQLPPEPQSAEKVPQPDRYGRHRSYVL